MEQIPNIIGVRLIYAHYDDIAFSPNQCLPCKHIQYVEATKSDVQSNAQGKNEKNHSWSSWTKVYSLLFAKITQRNQKLSNKMHFRWCNGLETINMQRWFHQCVSPFVIPCFCMIGTFDVQAHNHTPIDVLIIGVKTLIKPFIRVFGVFTSDLFHHDRHIRIGTKNAWYYLCRNCTHFGRSDYCRWICCCCLWYLWCKKISVLLILSSGPRRQLWLLLSHPPPTCFWLLLLRAVVVVVVIRLQDNIIMFSIIIFHLNNLIPYCWP
jgi:hypothetical protein